MSGGNAHERAKERASKQRAAEMEKKNKRDGASPSGNLPVRPLDGDDMVWVDTPGGRRLEHPPDTLPAQQQGSNTVIAMVKSKSERAKWKTPLFWTIAGIFGSTALAVVIFGGADIRLVPVLMTIAVLFALLEIVKRDAVRNGLSLATVLLCIVSVFILDRWFVVRKSNTSVPTAPTSDLAISSIQMLQDNKGHALLANVHYENDGPNTISAKHFYCVKLFASFPFKSINDKPAFDDTFGQSCIDGFRHDPQVASAPMLSVPRHTPLLVSIPIPPIPLNKQLLKELTPNGGGIVYFMGIFQYADSVGMHELQYCFTYQGNPDVMVLCHGHNGAFSPTQFK
jgi:hypothetical protein